MFSCPLLYVLLILYFFLLFALFSAIFFFNDTATTEIYTFPYTTLFRSFRLAPAPPTVRPGQGLPTIRRRRQQCLRTPDRKSTRLNSSHLGISYAVFCLKKKKNTK